MIRVLFLILLGVAACSHDTDRANPVDPQLTAPVQLQASLDDSTGHVRLSWTPYAGDQPFSAYVVLRNVARSLDVDTLGVLTDPDSGTFTDTSLSADTAYEYRVAVRNDAGYAQASEAQRVDGIGTSAVALLAPLPDSRAGHVTLCWPRYAEPAFQSYTLYRRPVGTDADSILARVSSVADTLFVDRSAAHGVSYIYRVDVSAAGQTIAGTAREGRLDLPSVAIDSVEFDSRTATATLGWQAYDGPRFATYEIWRTAGDERSLVQTLEDVSAGLWVDAELHGARLYEYEVRVVTDRGEQIEGATSIGRFHELVAEWPLGLEGDNRADSEFARLYPMGDGEMAVLVARWGDSVRGVVMDETGASGTQTTLTRNLLGSSGTELPPRGVALQPDRARSLFAYVGNSGVTPGLALFDEQGSPAGVPLSTEIDIADNASSASLITSTLEITGDRAATFSFGDIRVFAASDTVFRSPGFRSVRPGDFADLSFYKDDGDWRRFGVRLRVSQGDLATGHVRLGSSESGVLEVALSSSSIDLAWTNADGSPGPQQSAPIPHFMNSDIRDVIIEPTDTGFRVTMQGATIWSRGVITGSRTWASIAPYRDVALFTFGPDAYLLNADSSVDTVDADFPSDVAEMRSWTVGDDRSPTVGVCLPDVNAVGLAPVFREGLWGSLLSAESNRIGPLLDNGESLFYPISIDGHSDGRVYVLDAGNHRIVVLDDDGNYITQFGSKGDGPGQFDFLDGRRIGLVGRSYAGSVAVDEDGFIYVADVGNNRIQVFAP